MASPVDARPAPVQITKKLLQALAPLPTTVVQLLSLLDDPQVPLKQIADLASRDVGIAATLLRMANSPVLGMRGHVSSVTDALRLIGTVQARLLVLSCGVAQAGQKELPLYELPAGAFLRHSELVANLTVAAARQVGYTNAGTAYCAGLLHDIGKVVLNGLARQHPVVGERREALHAAIHMPHTSLLAAEQACFGADHCGMGNELASLWGLPQELAHCLSRHHVYGEPIDAQEPLPTCVALANAVAGAADGEYPAINRVELPERPIVPIEPLLGLATELLLGDRGAGIHSQGR